MLGYDETSKNYRLMDFSSGSIIRSRDVNFVESGMFESAENEYYDDVTPSDLPKNATIEEKTVVSDVESKDPVFQDAFEETQQKSNTTTRSGREVRKPKKFDDYASLG